ncbi:MAG: gas vesicle protein GvpG [Bacillota bacterium]
MFIIDDLLFLPFRGLWYVFAEIYNRVEAELYDESTVHQQLLELQFQYELGDLSQEEYEQKEKELLARLRAIKERQQNIAEGSLRGGE